MTRIGLVTMLAAGFVLGLGGCRTGASERMPLEAHLLQHGYVIKGPVDRVRAFRINGWNHIDRYNVILWASVRRPYLVTTRTPCDGLRSAETLAFTTTTGNLTRFEKLIVRAPGDWLEHCVVSEIRELERLELAD